MSIRVDEYADLIYRRYHDAACPTANRPAFSELPVTEQDAWRMAAAQLVAVVQQNVIDLLTHKGKALV
jgi:hypothetical protein